MVQQREWPDKHKHLVAKNARVVGLAGGQLAWSWDDNTKIDPSTLVTALPSVPASHGDVYVIGLEEVYLRMDAAVKRAHRGAQLAKRTAGERADGDGGEMQPHHGETTPSPAPAAAACTPFFTPPSGIVANGSPNV